MSSATLEHPGAAVADAARARWRMIDATRLRARPCARGV